MTGIFSFPFLFNMFIYYYYIIIIYLLYLLFLLILSIILFIYYFIIFTAKDLKFIRNQILKKARKTYTCWLINSYL